MESLAFVVTVLLAIDIIGSAIAMVLAWRATTVRSCFIAGVIGLPAAIVGVQFAVALASLAGVLLGLFGLLGFVFAVVRMWRLPRGAREA